MKHFIYAQPNKILCYDLQVITLCINPFTPIRNQDILSPCNVTNQAGNKKNEKKYIYMYIYMPVEVVIS